MKCPVHPYYQGKREPQVACINCVNIWRHEEEGRKKSKRHNLSAVADAVQRAKERK